MSKTSITGNVAIDYLKRYPSAPTKTIARVMLKENPTVFSDIEHARTTLRHYRGAKGSKLKSLATKDHIIEHGTVTRGFIPLPPTIDRNTPFEHVKIDCKKALILSDIHIPYHHPVALTASLDFGSKFCPDAIILNGDIADCHNVSHWEKDPRERRINYEVELATVPGFGILVDSGVAS